MSTTTLEFPVLDDDPFAPEHLADPYPLHERLREAAPVVLLGRYRVWAMARHEHVHAALSDHETFCSGAGAGLSNFRKEKPWRPPSLLLEADPPEHSVVRDAMGAVLSNRAVRALRETFQREAERLVDELVARGGFDAIKDLAEIYPLKVVARSHTSRPRCWCVRCCPLGWIRRFSELATRSTRWPPIPISGPV